MDVLYLIKDLLYSRNGLVIPEIGSITVHYYSAGIDRQRNKILPPRRKYSFNPFIKNDSDKILLKRLVATYNITEKEAREQIQKFVKEVKSKLDSGDNFAIDGVGYLKKDERGNIKFFQQEKETMGMEPVKAEPFELEKSDQPISKEDTEKTKKKKQKKRKGRFFIKISALILLVLFVTAGFLTGFFEFYIDKYTSGDIKQKQEERTVPDEDSEKGEEQNVDNQIEQELTGVTDKREALMYENKKGREEEKKEEKAKEKAEYHLIIGSFQHRKNAEQFRSQLSENEDNASIIEKDDLYRVSIKSFVNKQEALDSLYQMRDASPHRSVWLLKHKKTDR
ncbi:MAG: SPOR domain-containing protein [Bacteroidales bacterium]